MSLTPHQKKTCELVRYQLAQKSPALAPILGQFRPQVNPILLRLQHFI